ncbi:hypothetical protein SAMN05216573_102171 [Bradyrhizobium sp. Rc3b]|uniref:hypothetical protein n=1 Tax=Bradyrhizobium sp. Rc3b TaxID=1855322 RepID=UPI0008EF111E|nr:hypothetical protein [Bradyrhizobium sp. Rc3b]SFM50617.1 hypothetical protein SAMN05216573_102171 [Bradyrhizobium sp. Rc3b]
MATRKILNKDEMRAFLNRFREVDHYEAIGEFVYKFSQLEFLIKYRLFKELGLKQELFDIITAPYDFAVLCTVSAETLKAKPEIDDAKRKMVDRYFKDCKGFNAANRVVIAHGVWSTSGARHVSRSSLKPDLHSRDLKEIKAKCAEITQLVLRIKETNV